MIPNDALMSVISSYPSLAARWCLTIELFQLVFTGIIVRYSPTDLISTIETNWSQIEGRQERLADTKKCLHLFAIQRWKICHNFGFKSPLISCRRPGSLDIDILIFTKFWILTEYKQILKQIKVKPRTNIAYRRQSDCRRLKQAEVKAKSRP